MEGERAGKLGVRERYDKLNVPCKFRNLQLPPFISY